MRSDAACTWPRRPCRRARSRVSTPAHASWTAWSARCGGTCDSRIATSTRFRDCDPAKARARRSIARRQMVRPSRCRGATAPRGWCCTSSHTGRSVSSPVSPRTVAPSPRLLLDATGEFCGPERADELASSYRDQRVRVGKPPRAGPDGCIRYGWDERLRLGRGRTLVVSHLTAGGEPARAVGRFDGYARGASVVPLHALDGSTTRIATATVWDVTYAGGGEEPTHG